MKKSAELEALFKKNFEEGMMQKNFNQFKRAYPTLYTVIMKTLIDVEMSHNKPK